MKDEFFDPPKVMTCDPSKEIDSALLAYYISKHKAEISRYEMLWKMYRGRHAIVDAEEKDSYKPDNRIVANFARYVVETFNGYFMGKPVTVSHEDPELSKQVNRLMKLNDQDDNNAELSKLVRIYGRAYEFLYQNENTETCITYNSPLDMFMVYDDTIAQRPFFAVRYYLNEDNRLQGEIYTSDKVYDFIQGEKGYQIINDQPHYYQDVPVIEYVNNDERQGIFEPVISMINAFNKALSEKANDVDYFADAYLAILGVQLDKDGLQKFEITE